MNSTSYKYSDIGEPVIGGTPNSLLLKLDGEANLSSEFADEMDSELSEFSSGKVSLLSDGEEPEQGNLLIGFNGYLESSDGVPEREVAEMYREHGSNFVEHLDGSFRLVLFDQNRSRVYASGDKVGKKVLYVYEKDDKFIVSSHLKLLLDQEEVEAKPDPEGISRFLRSWSTSFSGGNRLIKDVERLDPSTLITCDTDTGKTEKRRFWDVYDRHRDVSDEEAASQLDGLLGEAADRLLDRCQGDLNVMLSGGFDSVFLTRLLRERTDRKINSYTWGWKKEHFADAERMSDRLGTDQNSLMLEHRLMDQEEIRFYEEPHNAFARYPFRELFNDYGVESYWTGLNSQATFPVCLKNVRKLDRAKFMKRFVKGRDLERIGRGLGRRDYRLQKAVSALTSENHSEALVSDWGLDQREADRLLDQSLRGYERPAEVLDRKWNLRDRSFQENYSYLQLRSRDTARYAYYTQHMEHFDVYGYTPLVEYSYSLPMNQKKNRRLLQKIAKGRVPDDIITKGASGWEFVSQQFARMIEADRSRYNEAISRFLDRGYLDEDVAEEFLMRDGYTDLGKGRINQMMAVYLLEIWMREFIN